MVVQAVMAYDEDGVYGLDACVEDWEVKGWWERGEQVWTQK